MAAAARLLFVKPLTLVNIITVMLLIKALLMVNLSALERILLDGWCARGGEVGESMSNVEH